MTGFGSVGFIDGKAASVALASADGRTEGASMKWSVGMSAGKGAGRNTGPAAAEEAKARAQTHRVRLMASG